MNSRTTSIEAGKAESCRTNLVERDAADCSGQTDRAAGLVLDPSHAKLIGTHVGTGGYSR
jgi:hypothetical protein